MKQRLLKSVWTALYAGMAAVVSITMAGCSDDDLSNNANVNPVTPGEVQSDELKVMVTADVPTAVVSSFDDNSMGGALVRRLSKTTNEVTDDTKMILVKGEDIMNRPFTEWMQAAKIYLRGGYIAVEKPHDAHLVKIMEELSSKLEQASHDILTEDDGSGITIKITPSNGQPSANAVNADAERFKTRISNIDMMAGENALSNEPVAEMVIFSRNGYYQRVLYGTQVVTHTVVNKDGTTTQGTQTITREYNNAVSGMMADGAAQWLNTKSSSQAVRSQTRANGTDAINNLMSASEEHTFQADLAAKCWYNDGSFCDKTDEQRFKPGAYNQIYRIWCSHNMDTNKDYYFVQQHTTASVGGKQEGDARFDASKTLYQGPYEANKWMGTDNFSHTLSHENKVYFKWWYGTWFENADYSMNLTGAGDVMLEDAVPYTDNNDASATVTVGEYNEETTNIGGSVTPVITTKEVGVKPSVSYSHGYTNGTLYTMGYTSGTKELKVQKNTDGTKVTWNYANSKIMTDGDLEEHPLVPDALTSDIDMMNQVCWSVTNPEGSYTLSIEDSHNMACLANNNGNDNFMYKEGATDGTTSYILGIPNRSQQTWRMDVDFPEIGQSGHEGQKGQLTDYLKQQFPDLYQPTIVLADQTPESENTILNLVNNSKAMLFDANALQTLKGYALDMGISQFTIKWYCTEGQHNTYDMTVSAQ